jgi:hypothetical protein
MKFYTIYNGNTGEVLRTGIAPDDQVAAQVGPYEALLLDVQAPPFTYIDDGEFVPMPEEPSPNHRFDWATKTWYDPRTVADHRAAKWNELKQARSQAEFAPLTVGSHTFDADAKSQQNIAGAVQLATLAADGWTIDWTLADNTTATLSKAEMVAVGVALGERTSSIYAYARGLRETLDEAIDIEGVQAVVWSYPQ